MDWTKSCSTCMWYQRTNAGSGECRARPPSAFVMPVEGLQGIQPAIIGGFPAVGASQWCKEFLLTQMVEVEI